MLMFILCKFWSSYARRVSASELPAPESSCTKIFQRISNEWAGATHYEILILHNALKKFSNTFEYEYNRTDAGIFD